MTAEGPSARFACLTMTPGVGGARRGSDALRASRVSSALKGRRYNAAPLFDDLERGTVVVARSRAGEQGADRLNRLTVPADDTSDIRLSHGDAKDGCISARALRDDDFVGEFNQVAEDELEELFHAISVATEPTLSPCDTTAMWWGETPSRLRVDAQ